MNVTGSRKICGEIWRVVTGKVVFFQREGFTPLLVSYIIEKRHYFPIVALEV